MDVESRGKKRRYSAGGKSQPKGKQAKVTTAQVKRIVHNQSEPKYFDTFVDNTAVPTGAGGAGIPVSPATGIFLPTAGGGITNRIGNSVYLTKIRLCVKIYALQKAIVAAGILATNIRFALVRDKEPSPAGTALAAGDVFQNIATTVNVGSTDLMNIQNLGRFEVLKQRMFVLENPNISTTGYNGLSKFFKIEHQFRTPVKCRFNASTGFPVTEEFHVIVWSDATAAGTSLDPFITYTSRCVFKED